MHNCLLYTSTKGCLNYGLKFQFKNGTEHITFRKNDGYFLKCFTDGLFERNRCLSCEYKGCLLYTSIKPDMFFMKWMADMLENKFKRKNRT